MTSAPANRCVLLTPAGTGAIGVIRLRGPDASQILSGFFRSARHGSRSPTSDQFVALFRDDRVRYGRLVDDDEVIDDALVCSTSVDTTPAYDICTHGGVRIIERILEVLERAGAPLADESDQSAFVWSAGHLIEIEAVMGMGEARTARGVHFLAWQRNHLTVEIERLASCGDGDFEEAAETLRTMMARYRAARLLIGGATVAIVGPPNCGKSTLFNQLVGRSTAIVSPTPGTTLDWVEAPLEIDGIPITLVDTAGDRETADVLERVAIQRGSAVGRRADVRLLLLDASRALPADIDSISSRFDADASMVAVANKMDLKPAWHAIDLGERYRNVFDNCLTISSMTGEGLDKLEQHILGKLGLVDWVDSAPTIFTERQLDLVRRVLSEHQNASSGRVVHLLRQLVGAPPSCSEGSIEGSA